MFGYSFDMRLAVWDMRFATCRRFQRVALHAEDREVGHLVLGADVEGLHEILVRGVAGAAEQDVCRLGHRGVVAHLTVKLLKRHDAALHDEAASENLDVDEVGLLLGLRVLVGRRARRHQPGEDVLLVERHDEEDEQLEDDVDHRRHFRLRFAGVQSFFCHSGCLPLLLFRVRGGRLLALLDGHEADLPAAARSADVHYALDVLVLGAPVGADQHGECAELGVALGDDLPEGGVGQHGVVDGDLRMREDLCPARDLDDDGLDGHVLLRDGLAVDGVLKLDVLVVFLGHLEGDDEEDDELEHDVNHRRHVHFRAFGAGLASCHC